MTGTPRFLKPAGPMRDPHSLSGLQSGAQAHFEGLHQMFLSYLWPSFLSLAMGASRCACHGLLQKVSSPDQSSASVEFGDFTIHRFQHPQFWYLQGTEPLLTTRATCTSGVCCVRDADDRLSAGTPWKIKHQRVAFCDCVCFQHKEMFLQPRHPCVNLLISSPCSLPSNSRKEFKSIQETVLQSSFLKKPDPFLLSLPDRQQRS